MPQFDKDAQISSMLSAAAIERARRQNSSAAVDSEPNGASSEMPRYKCHKEVWALKIGEVVDPAAASGNESDGSRILRFEEYGYAPIRVSPEYVRNHKPTAGGYYVVYKDGYKSFSPAEAFEDGYTREK